MFSRLSDDEILDMAGIERFDPGGTQYSDYMTPGLRDYFETEYRFADPGQLYPLGPRNVPGFGAHDFGNPESGFMHVRGPQSHQRPRTLKRRCSCLKAVPAATCRRKRGSGSKTRVLTPLDLTSSAIGL